MSIFFKLDKLTCLALCAVLLICLNVQAQTTIINRWTGDKIGLQNGTPYCATTATDNWVIEPAEPGFVRLKNEATGTYLHTENNQELGAGAIDQGWWSAQWALAPIDGYTQIINRWTNQYLHNENGKLEAGSLGAPGWWSAQWTLAAPVAQNNVKYNYIVPPVQQLVSLAHISNPDAFFVKHLPTGAVRIGKIEDKNEKNDATFLLVKGVSANCSDCISFESVNKPGHYLRHQNGDIRLTTLANDLDRADASFRQIAGLAGTGNSYEAFNYPNHFIKSGALLTLAPRTEDAAYKKEVSFIQKGSQIENMSTGKRSADEVHAFMDPLVFNQKNTMVGNQETKLSLTVTPNMHISNSGSQVIVFDMDGSILRENSGNLTVNNKKERAWFYENVKVNIVNSNNVKLVKVPNVQNTETGEMTSSLENTFNVNLNASYEGLTGGLGLTKTENKTFTRTVKGYTLDPPTMNGNTATHNIRMTGCYDGESGGLKPYSKWEDATNKEKWQNFWDGFIGAFTLDNYYGFDVYGLTDPALGKGLYVPVQAAYLAPNHSTCVAYFRT